MEAIRLCVHLALENVQGVKVKVTEVGDETVLPESIFVSPYVASILGDLPLIQVRAIHFEKSNKGVLIIHGICPTSGRNHSSVFK